MLSGLRNRAMRAFALMAASVIASVAAVASVGLVQHMIAVAASTPVSF